MIVDDSGGNTQSHQWKVYRYLGKLPQAAVHMLKLCRTGKGVMVLEFSQGGGLVD